MNQICVICHLGLGSLDVKNICCHYSYIFSRRPQSQAKRKSRIILKVISRLRNYVGLLNRWASFVI